MKNKFQNFISFLTKHGIVIISVIVALLGILSIFITAYLDSTYNNLGENTFFKYNPGIIEIIIATLLITLLFALTRLLLKKVSSKYILIPILIILCFIYFYWINIMKLSPESDQKSVHEIAAAIINAENLSEFLDLGDRYIRIFPYQFGIAYIFSLIYRIWGQNYMYIQYVNAICSIINIILIVFISKLLFNKENIQKILVFLLAVFGIYWMFFNVHVYGNIIGLTFALTSLFFTILYLKKGKLYNVFLAGIFIALSILAKSNYNIFLCGIILLLILNLIQKWNFKTLLSLLIITISIFIVNTSYKTILREKYNVVLDKGMPMISYVAMGMDKPGNMAPGWYTGINLDIYGGTYYNYEKTEEFMKKFIIERLTYFSKNPLEFISYYSQKIGSTWLNPTYQTIFYSIPGPRIDFYPDYAQYFSYQNFARSMLDGNLYKFEEWILNIYQIIIFNFGAIGIYLISKKKELSDFLIPVIFIGGFIFHIIWETKAIYVIQYYFLLLPYTAYGLNYIFDKILELLEKQKQLKLNEKNSK